MPISRFLALLAVAMAIPACPTPQTQPENPGTASALIDCGVPAVRDHALVLIPAVNDCIIQPAGWVGCLLGLIKPAAGITEDVLACATRAAGRSQARSADNDPVSQAAASHAANFLDERKYKFRDDIPHEP